jgi:hypothetical protein
MVIIALQYQRLFDFRCVFFATHFAGGSVALAGISSRGA